MPGIIGTPFSNDLIRMMLDRENQLDDRNLRAAIAEREIMAQGKERALRSQLAQQEMGLRQEEMGLKRQSLEAELAELGRKRQDVLDERDFIRERDTTASKRATDAMTKEYDLRAALAGQEYRHRQALNDAELSTPLYKARVEAAKASVGQKEADTVLKQERANEMRAGAELTAEKSKSIIQLNLARVASIQQHSQIERKLAEARALSDALKRAQSKQQEARLAHRAIGQLMELFRFQGMDGSPVFAEGTPGYAQIMESIDYLKNYADGQAGAAPSEESSLADQIRSLIEGFEGTPEK